MATANAKKARALRRAEQPSRPDGPPSGFWTPWRAALVAFGAAAVVAASFVVPGLLNKESVSAGAEHAIALGADHGEGLPTGATVPWFAERDLQTGRPITSQTVYDEKTLLYFSEGIMCQACFEQIRGLEQLGTVLEQRGISLVSVTPDSPGELRAARRQFGITTPMISDSDRSISEAFNTLGKGMHADTPGHAFALIDKGKVLWYRDYWLPPDRTMYVSPHKLLDDISG